MIGFKLKHITDVDAAIDFVLDRVLKFSTDHRGALERIITDPRYIYFTTMTLPENLGGFPFTVQVVDLPGQYYMNAHDYKVEVPYEQGETIKYKTIYNGEIFTASGKDVLSLLDVYVSTGVLKKFGENCGCFLLTEDGRILFQENLTPIQMEEEN